MITYAELLKNRRSIRNYKNKEISAELMNEILNDTCQAPSSMNRQPWEFIIIKDKTLMEKISTESKNNLLSEIKSDPNSEIKKYEDSLKGPFNVFYNAPCLVMIVTKQNYWHCSCDCGLVAAYFMFAATARGLGTCWIGLGENIQDPDIKKEIGLPEGYRVVSAIIVGYPEEVHPFPDRKPVIVSQK
jgi:nitroreductase